RIEAVRKFIEKYNKNEVVSFSLLLWNNSVIASNISGTPDNNNCTTSDDTFTKDQDVLNCVLNKVVNSKTTNYTETLKVIKAAITTDINKTKLDAQNLSRTKYIVVFFSDGMPYVENSDGTPGIPPTPEDVRDDVDAIYKDVIADGVGSFAFNTVFLPPPVMKKPEELQKCKDYLTEMADAGKGSFVTFENAESIDFLKIVDTRLTVEYVAKYIFAYNQTVRCDTKLAYADSDSDGLTDEEEIEYGTDLTRRDTDDDGLSDFFELRSASPDLKLDPLVFDNICEGKDVDGIWVDSDNDGLTDCEEFIKGTNPKAADTDKDGIPDGIEILEKISPLQAQGVTDSDLDGAPDYQELQNHSNLRLNDSNMHERYNYKYTLDDKGLIPLEQGSDTPSYVRKFDLEISNIDLIDAIECQDGYKIEDEEYQYRYAGDNIIDLYIAEIPEDKPDSTPLFRRARVVVNTADAFKEADGVAKIKLFPSDFVLIK
ncbi:MAG: hypothetical protein V1872_10540, partial [bacterium]